MTESFAHWKRWAARTGAGMLLVAAVVLAWRRLAGGLHAPERPGLLLFAVGAGLAALVAAGRALANGAATDAPAAPRSQRGALLVTAGFTVLVLALSLPGASLLALALLWGPLVVEECWAWGLVGALGDRVRTAASRRKRDGSADGEETPPGTPAAPVLAAGEGLSEEPPADDVLQQLVRTRSADGDEVLAGWLRVPLAAGERSASVHLAFCPPFARAPRVELVQSDGPAARIKTVQVLPYGARFDLGFSAPAAEGDAVLLQFSAGTQRDE